MKDMEWYDGLEGKAFAIKPDIPSSTPGTLIEDGKSQLLQVVLCMYTTVREHFNTK